MEQKKLTGPFQKNYSDTNQTESWTKFIFALVQKRKSQNSFFFFMGT